jgi:hypothetical protein
MFLDLANSLSIFSSAFLMAKVFLLKLSFRSSIEIDPRSLLFFIFSVITIACFELEIMLLIFSLSIFESSEEQGGSSSGGAILTYDIEVSYNDKIAIVGFKNSTSTLAINYIYWKIGDRSDNVHRTRTSYDNVIV